MHTTCFSMFEQVDIECNSLIQIEFKYPFGFLNSNEYRLVYNLTSIKSNASHTLSNKQKFLFLSQNMKNC